MVIPPIAHGEAPPPEKKRSEHESSKQYESDERQIREAQSLDAKTTYEVIRREGKLELARSSDALFWSGLAAGLSMGLSFLGEALLRAHLPEVPWRHLVSKLGYSFGFLVVILGSQQLFTENTLTPMVPLLSEKSRETLRNVLRLWAVVFVANLVGTLLFALALDHLAIVEPETKRAMGDIATDAMRHDWWTTLARAVVAGWLIALLVWMLPGGEKHKFAVIVIMSWLIGAGGLAHVIAGSSEVFYAASRGAATWAQAVFGFIVPSLLGNMLGGITLVAALNHGQATPGE